MNENKSIHEIHENIILLEPAYNMDTEQGEQRG